MTYYGALFIFPALMAYAAASDLFTMRIANWVSIAVVAGYLAMALMLGLPMKEIGYHLACGFIVLVATFTMFALGWIGGGDAKLAAATAVWFGFSGILVYLVVAAAYGGILTVLLLQLRRFPLPDFMMRQEWIARLHDKKTGIPYGIALAAAALVIYPNTNVWTSAIGA